MHCLVIGAGIVGLSTAYLLRRAGFQVTVIDREREVGAGASHANGAQLSYSYVAPLAGPGVIAKIPKYLLDQESPLRFRPELSFDQWMWCARFLMACNRAKSERTIRVLYALAESSRKILDELLHREFVKFDYSNTGKLVVYDDQQDFEKAKMDMDFLGQFKCQQRVLDRDECSTKEPSLKNISRRIVGGIFSRDDASGDCQKLCESLSREVSSGHSNSAIMTGVDVFGIECKDGRVVSINTSVGELTADYYVVASGMGTRSLVKPLGFDIPIYPLGGYSLTVDIDDEDNAPKASITDFGRKTVYARVGNQIRSAAFVEIGRSHDVDIRKVRQLVANSNEVFGRAAEFSKSRVWHGFRPATADGLPIVGRTPISNLFVNAGHGALGFTLALGTSAKLADELSALA